jgi:hypothetical protein
MREMKSTSLSRRIKRKQREKLCSMPPINSQYAQRENMISAMYEPALTV